MLCPKGYAVVSPGRPRNHNAVTMAPSINPAYRIRPLLLGDILDEAFRIYRARFGLMALTALLASVPALLVGLGGGANTLIGAYMQNTLGTGTAFDRAGLDGSLFWLIAVGGLAGLVLFPVTSALPSLAASAATLGLPETSWSILRFAFRNYLRLLVFGLVNIVMSIVLVFFFWLVFPIYLLVRWSFVYQAFYLERAGIGGSFSRSSALCFNSWWRIFGIRLLTRVIVSVIGFVLGIVFALPSLLMPLGVIRQSTTGVLSAVVAAFLLPYPALVSTLLYLDQRVRLEALDLQLMAGQAGAPAAPQVAPQASWGAAPPSSELPPPSR